MREHRRLAASPSTTRQSPRLPVLSRTESAARGAAPRSAAGKPDAADRFLESILETFGPRWEW